MGLFDVFGAGGGTLTLVPGSTQVSPGSVLSGTATFTGGKRAQNVTNIKVRFVCEERHPPKPGQPPPAPQTKDVTAPIQLTGAFQTQPGTPHAFPFQIQLPPQLAPEVKGHTDYKLIASVDIPGEVDAHATVDVQVLGGGGMGMGAPMGMGMGAPMGMGMGAPMGMPMQAPIGIGSEVVAQHPMGGVHPGRVVATQNGMFGIDWHDPNLGQSTWVAQSAVQASGMGMGGMGMPPPMAAPLQIGSGVVAQHMTGGWHPGRIVGLQNGLVGVDWADPKLGASAWLQPHQVQAGK